MHARQAYTMLIETYLLIDDGDHAVLRQYELTPTQYAALTLLDQQIGKRLTDLTGPLLVDKSTVTRLIDRLEHEQLINRIPDPEDRRAQRILLTPLGLARREQARVILEQSITQRMNHLSVPEQEQLITILGKLRESIVATQSH
jgi:DNA-binding MarR family transcriptional regulator